MSPTRFCSSERSTATAPATGLSEQRQRAGQCPRQAFPHFDGAGAPPTDRYDFKGNLLRGARRFARDWRGTPDWSADPALEDEAFAVTTAYDALNRATRPHHTGRQLYPPELQRSQPGGRGSTSICAASGPMAGGCGRRLSPNRLQRQGPAHAHPYANGATTRYEYDPRLSASSVWQPRGIRRRTAWARRSSRLLRRLQDLHYTYDPSATSPDRRRRAAERFPRQPEDRSRLRLHLRSALSPVEATGRENIGQVRIRLRSGRRRLPRLPLRRRQALDDLQALRNFVERYDYDPAGNFTAVRHITETAAGSWTRPTPTQARASSSPAAQQSPEPKPARGRGDGRALRLRRQRQHHPDAASAGDAMGLHGPPRGDLAAGGARSRGGDDFLCL